MIARFSLASLILTLATFGGMLAYAELPAGAVIIQVLTLATLFAGLALVLIKRTLPGVALVPLAILATLAASLAFHWSVVGLWVVTLWAAATAALILAANFIKEIEPAMTLAGWVWAGLFPVLALAGWQDNPNIAAFWPFLFIMVAIGGGRPDPAYLLMMCGYLLWLGSRGGLLGVAVGLAVWYYYQQQQRRVTLYSLAGLVVLALLLARRPTTAGYRFGYWAAAWQVFLDHPLTGVGPGGLWTNQLIPEPGNLGHHTHAHNFIVSWLAENGLIGSLGGSLATLAAAPVNLPLSKIALLAGVVAWSIVDQPLWWPGPLLAFGLVIGSKHDE